MLSVTARYHPSTEHRKHKTTHKPLQNHKLKSPSLLYNEFRRVSYTGSSLFYSLWGVRDQLLPLVCIFKTLSIKFLMIMIMIMIIMMKRRTSNCSNTYWMFSISPVLF